MTAKYFGEVAAYRWQMWGRLRADKKTPNEGLEPSTIRLRAWRSTDWASPASYGDVVNVEIGTQLWQYDKDII